MTDALDVAGRIALIVGAGGPSVSATVQLLGVPKKRASRAALGFGMVAAVGISWAAEKGPSARMALDVALGGPMAGIAAMGTYEGARRIKRPKQ